MSNSKAKETKDEVDNFLDEIEKIITEDEEGLHNRLIQFREQLADYTWHPIQFTILADSVIAFYKVSDEQQEKWLAGGIAEKIFILQELNELEDTKTMMERVMHFADILFYTHTMTGESIYKLAATKMLYVMSGFDAFLTGIGMSLYRMPPSRPPKIKIPKEDKTEGMYHQ